MVFEEGGGDRLITNQGGGLILILDKRKVRNRNRAQWLWGVRGDRGGGGGAKTGLGV